MCHRRGYGGFAGGYSGGFGFGGGFGARGMIGGGAIGGGVIITEQVRGGFGGYPPAIGCPPPPCEYGGFW